MTGEIVGQVASQTLENMAVIGKATSLPMLRPLIGMDRDEIVAEAQGIGTYGTSIMPDEDCCQMFTPRHPLTKSTSEQIEEFERRLPIDALVRQAVDEVVRENYQFLLRQPRAGSCCRVRISVR